MNLKYHVLILSMLGLLFVSHQTIASLTETTKNPSKSYNVAINSEAKTEKKKRKLSDSFAESSDTDYAKSTSKATPFKPQPANVLQPLSNTFSLNIDGANGKFAVIGQDTRVRPRRTTEYPLQAIGRLEIFWEGKSGLGTCSATLIGPDKLITAAHCVYDKENKQFAKRIYFTPGRDGDYIPYGMYGAKTVYMPADYPNSQMQSGNSDIAVISLATPIGNRLGYLGFGAYQAPPEHIKESIAQELKFIGQQVAGDESAYRKKATEYMETAHQRFPDYSLSYFGYSGDKNGEVWGDTCIHFLDENISSENYPQIKTFCDYQRGASGSAFIDNNQYVRGVNSFHHGSKSSMIVNRDGGTTGDFKGDAFDVGNYSVGISSYSMNLLINWKNNQYGNETLVKHYSNANNLKQVSIDNECRATVWIAFRYKNWEGDWVNNGFYKVPPYKDASITTSSEYIYYHALEDQGDRVWSGSDTYQTLHGREYGFRKRTTSDAYKNIIKLSCD